LRNSNLTELVNNEKLITELNILTILSLQSYYLILLLLKCHQL